MIASVLTKYLKKVKEFANEKSSYELCKNVKIKGTEKQITYWCCDGDSGIKQISLNNHGSPLLGEFCVDVFKFYTIISSMPKDVDIKFNLNTDNYRLNVKTDLHKFTIVADSPDKVYQMKDHNNWNNVEQVFFDRLKSVVPLCLVENYPIVFDGNLIYYASPHEVVYVPLNSNLPNFKINLKVAPKIFVDTFDKMDANENHIFFSNDNCEIYIPQTNSKSAIIKPISDKVNEFHKIIAEINTSELNSIFNIIQSLHKKSDVDVRSVEMIFDKNTLKLIYLQSAEFLVGDVKFNNEDSISIKIPFDHLGVITSTEFTKNTPYIEILLAKNNQMFVARKSPQLTFVGGLSK
jgi:hypothetical protein